mgnify:CR=1 FL=1
MKIRINSSCRKRRQDRYNGMGRCLCIEPKRLCNESIVVTKEKDYGAKNE